jgi:hypothetical protein
MSNEQETKGINDEAKFVIEKLRGLDVRTRRLIQALAALAIAAAALAALLLLSGCTAGQLAPGGVKDCVYSAQADGVATLEEIRTGRAEPTAAAACLRRIVGTPGCLAADGSPAPYEDGLLSPVRHWMSGTKSVQRSSSQPAK